MNLAEAQIFCIYEMINFIVIGEYENFMFTAF